MNLRWEIEEDKDLCLFIDDENIHIGIYFEDEVRNSNFSFYSKNPDKIYATYLPQEFIDALREHLEARK